MHNDITLANTTRGISLYIHLSIRSIASQQANGKNTSEAHHQPVQAICSTYLLPYSVNIKKAVKPLGITALKFISLFYYATLNISLFLSFHSNTFVPYLFNASINLFEG